MYQRASPVLRAFEIGGEECSGQDFRIRLTGHHHAGMLREVLDTLHAEGLDVVEAHADVANGTYVTDEHTDKDVFIVRSRGAVKDFDDEKLHEISHHLHELLGKDGTKAKISFEPVAKGAAESGRWIVEPVESSATSVGGWAGSKYAATPRGGAKVAPTLTF